MKMNRFKFSISSLNLLKLMMTLTLKIHSILIYDPIVPRTWQMKKETCRNCTTCFACQIKGLSIFTSHISNYQYNCNSFFNVDMIASSFDTIYPKNKSSSSTTINWSITTLTWFNWKDTYNIKKRAHNTNIIICHNLNGMCMAHKIPYNLHVFELRVKHDGQHVMSLGLIIS